MSAQDVRIAMRTQRIIVAMRAGAVLHRTNRSSSTNWQLSTGMQVAEETAKVIVARGDIVGAGDSLFDDRLSQTFRWHAPTTW